MPPPAIQIMNGLWLLREILKLGDAGLHVVRHLVSGDSGLNLRIPDFTGVVAIERVDQVETSSLGGSRDTGRVRDEHNRITLFSKLHPLIERRKKTAAPTRAAA